MQQLQHTKGMQSGVFFPTYAECVRVRVLRRAELTQCTFSRTAFASQRKDWRFYELVEDTIHQDFDYRYFVFVDQVEQVRAVQPFLIIDQDLLAGVPRTITTLAGLVRHMWPRFLHLRTLMVGCAVGEGHLDGLDEAARHANARALGSTILAHARALGARLVVFKEFPASYRPALQYLLKRGFARIPSMPMVYRNIEYRSFDDYVQRTLSKKMRWNLRRKFADAAKVGLIEMSQVGDVTPFIEDIYPLYLQVYQRSDLRFERLSKEFLCELGQRMPDKVRFFLWRHGDRIVAFAVCMVHGDAIYFEYIGLDYTVALDLHLYFLVLRDVMSWAIARGCKTFYSSALNYDPKYRLRFLLSPLDLYVRHTSGLGNFLLRLVLPLLGPTRYDENLKRFPNFHDLVGS